MAYSDLKDGKQKGQPRQEWFPLSQDNPPADPSSFDTQGFTCHKEGSCSIRPKPPVSHCYLKELQAAACILN